MKPEPFPDRDPLTEQLLELLRRTRRERELTVRELAQAAGVSPSYISLIENGRKVPDAGTIERIGRALELDPALLKAWVTVRGRSDDTEKSVQAAYELMDRLGTTMRERGARGRAMRVAEPDVLHAREPSAVHQRASVDEYQLPFAEPRTVSVPVLQEGTEPGGGGRESRPLLLDERVAERLPLTGAWAWRMSRVGVERIPGVYRPGDFVVISPSAWAPDPRRFKSRMVFAVRHDAQVLLSHVDWTGNHLILVPGGRQPAVVLSAGADTLRKAIAGRVVAAVVGFG